MDGDVHHGPQFTHRGKEERGSWGYPRDTAGRIKGSDVWVRGSPFHRDVDGMFGSVKDGCSQLTNFPWTPQLNGQLRDLDSDRDLVDFDRDGVYQIHRSHGDPCHPVPDCRHHSLAVNPCDALVFGRPTQSGLHLVSVLISEVSRKLPPLLQG